MQKLSVDTQIEKIVDDFNLLPDQVQQAAILALNRTGEWMKGRIAKDISEEKRLKLKLIRDRIVLSRANRRKSVTTLACNFRSIFVKDLPNVRQNVIGVTAGGQMYPHAFIATLRKGGKPGVYQRTTTKRFPVKRVTIPIYSEANRIIEQLIGTEAQKIFGKRFLHEIDRISRAA